MKTWWRGQIWWRTKGEPLSKARSPLKGERKKPTKTSGDEKITNQKEKREAGNVPGGESGPRPE